MTFEPTFQGLHGFLDRSIERYPDGVAIDVPPGPGRERRTWTYRAFDERIRTWERALQPHARREAIVALLASREDPDVHAAQIAALRRGCAYTYLDPSLPDERLRFILEDTRAVACFVDAGHATRLQRIAPSLPALSFSLEPVRPASTKPLQPVLVRSTDLAYVIYTSGTTGQPKGVALEHGGIVNLIASDIEHFALQPGDRVAQGSSLAYDSSVEETWLALAAGGTVVVLDDEMIRRGPDLVTFLREERITVLCPPPTLLRTMDCADPVGALPELHLLYVGGEAMPSDLVDLWGRAKHVENGYGPTECSVTVMRTRLLPGERVTIGRPVPGNEAHIVDSELQLVPEGEPGELLIAGVSLARGYLHEDDLTRERFIEHARFGRCYRTGDLVRRLPTGDHEYLGRIDTQVKVRGYRIELEEIESRLVQVEGVRAAACTVQDDALVAALVSSNEERPPLETVRTALTNTLPPYMVPAHFTWLDVLPTSVSGKLDRRRLPRIAPQRIDDPDEAVPSHDLDPPRWIAKCWRQVLKLARAPTPEDDFFDQGGTSLQAAELVSALRLDPRTAPLTVRDVYERRTLQGLIDRTRDLASEGIESAPRPQPTSPRELPPFLLGSILQTTVLLAFAIASGGLAYLLGFLLLPWLIEHLGLLPFLCLSPLLSGVAIALWFPLALALAVLAKRLLVGRYRPGRIRAWSPAFVRHWTAQRFVRLVPWGALEHTGLFTFSLRALGARIGKNVYLHRGVRVLDGGYDLLTIEDSCTLGRDVVLRTAMHVDGHVVFAKVHLGAGVVLETRAGVSGGTTLEAGARITALSSAGPDAMPAHGVLDGVPARRVDDSPSEPAIDGDDQALSETAFGVLYLLARATWRLAASLPFVALLALAVVVLEIDAATLLDFLYAPWTRPTWAIVFVTLTVLAVPLRLLLQACFLRTGRSVAAGIHHRRSKTALRILLRMRIVEAAGTWLSGTLTWPAWLRLAGMRIGRGCEISSIMEVLPERVTIGAGTFFADGIYLGGPAYHGETVTVGETSLGRGTFLGNHVVIPTGARLPNDVLLGVCTRADETRIRSGTSWFGHPPMELPRREVATMDRSLTHEPTRWRYAVRLFWETLRVALPVLPTFLLMTWFGALDALVATTNAPGAVLLLASGTTILATSFFLLVVLVLKWCLLGRVRPGRHGLWSGWCSRWDFLYVAWGRYARRPLMALEGTLWLAWYLRAMGMHIGRRVLLGQGFAQVVDPDMLHVEDGATFDPLLQAHSFEDRVLKIDHVHVHAFSTVADQALLLYGAQVGRGSQVAPQSVVMKHERLLPGRYYAGAPTRETHPVIHAEAQEP